MHRRAVIQLASLCLAGPSWSASGPAPLRMAYFDKYEPFSQRQPDGSMGGLLIDAVELVGRACGLSFEHAGFPWARAQLLVERGELDALCTVATPARLAWMDFCNTPMVSASYSIFHRSDDARPAQARHADDLRQLRQGTYRGSGYSRGLLKLEHLQIENDAESVLRRIAQGTLDTFVESELIIGPKLRQLGLAGRIAATPAPFLPAANFCFGLRRSYPQAAALVARMEAATQAAQQSGALPGLLAKYR